MDIKDIQKQFRAGTWANQQQMDAFVIACEVLPPPELLKLMAMFSEKALSAEGLALRNRLTIFKRLVEAGPDSQLFAPFVKQLKTADPGLRTVLVDLLPKVNSVAGHTELAALLRLPD